MLLKVFYCTMGVLGGAAGGETGGEAMVETVVEAEDEARWVFESFPFLSFSSCFSSYIPSITKPYPVIHTKV